jgi:cytochrome b
VERNAIQEYNKCVKLTAWLLPNRGFRQSVGADPGSRWKYWAARIALAAVVVLAIWFLGIQQHPPLR